MHNEAGQPATLEENWIDTDAPREGQIVRVRAQDDGGFYTLPFRVAFCDDAWFNAETGEELDCFVAAWAPWE